MTINQYLWYLEWLQIKRDRKYEEYMRMTERATSPQSSLHSDGTPRAKDVRSREKMLISSSSALEEYFDADTEHSDYMDKMTAALGKLEFRDRYVLETAYIFNLNKPRENRTSGIAKFLGVRKKDVPGLMKEAKEHLRELLISEGIEIE